MRGTRVSRISVLQIHSYYAVRAYAISSPCGLYHGDAAPPSSRVTRAPGSHRHEPRAHPSGGSVGAQIYIAMKESSASKKAGVSIPNEYLLHPRFSFPATGSSNLASKYTPTSVESLPGLPTWSEAANLGVTFGVVPVLA
eukprot:1182790-Prorocentrum_minimum.AAC.2